MIRINRIAYAVFSTADLGKQVDYYTHVLGLTLVEKSAKAVYLSGGVDHHRVELRNGSEAGCAVLGIQVRPDTDLKDFVAQIESHGIKAHRRSDAQPNIADLVIV
jgi:catechol 2,3-dioxygenase-like lactoylglutathione lyase family enzyme